MKRARQQARRRRDARRSAAVSRLRRRANARLTAQTSPQDTIKLLKSTVQQAEARIWLSQQRLEQLALKERDELAAARLRNTVLEEELRQSNARQALLRDELGAASLRIRLLQDSDREAQARARLREAQLQAEQIEKAEIQQERDQLQDELESVRFHSNHGHHREEQRVIRELSDEKKEALAEAEQWETAARELLDLLRDTQLQLQRTQAWLEIHQRAPLQVAQARRLQQSIANGR